MVDSIKHRGPDDDGIYSGEGIALGMTRLSIIDLTESAHQPMQNDNGTIWIVYNGETYNYKVKKEELLAQGHSFRSNSDTEVVLKLYEQYGDSFLYHMRGMFALAIYDKRKGPGKERLIIARDHFGIKPLLYAKIGELLIFASEVKAFLASGFINPRFDPEALRLLMSIGSIPQPMTAIAGVSMLKPGHMLIVENGVKRIKQYHKLGKNRIRSLREKSYFEQMEVLKETLVESIRLQMVSDVPIGAFLSGGIDSSLSVALMANLSNRRIKTFSVGFEDEGTPIDESDDALKISQFIGTDHSRVMVTGKDFFDRVTHIARALDQPSVDGVNSYFVSLAARKAVTVAISGTGGDELFAGYPWFLTMAYLSNQDRKPSFIKRTLKLLSDISRHSFFNRFVGGGLETMLNMPDFYRALSLAMPDNIRYSVLTALAVFSAHR